MTNHAAADLAVEYERRGHVGVIQINRPEAKNAVNAAVATGVGRAFAERRRPEWAGR